MRRWRFAELDTELAAELAEECEIHPFLSLLLTTQGLRSPEDVFAYIIGTGEETDPYSFADMEKAAERIQQAVDAGEPILVYGDYDVDGITATVLLYTCLRELGATVEWQIPRREEGYGLHREQLAQIAARGVKLIVTVDTGVSLSPEEVAFAAEAGVEIVVTDHHQPPVVLPAVRAVVNPHRPDCESGCVNMAGVEVAFMLACVLEGDGETALQRYGDLVALGTLADLVPLTGGNRDLLRRAMALLEASERPGLRALRRSADCDDKELTATAVSFSLAPRLNAAGRMGDPEMALRLLLTEDDGEAARLAEQIHGMNNQRREMSQLLFVLAEKELEAHPEWAWQRVLVVCGEGWHGGLLGILAARLAEQYGKPTLVLSVDEDGMAHGSGRSVEGVSLYAGLEVCADLLTVFGGHEMAAGLSLPRERVAALRERLNRWAAEEYPCMPVAELPIALRLRPDQINMEKLLLMDVMEPVGAGNPAPLFCLSRMQLDNITAMGGGKHLRLSLSRDAVRISAVLFNRTPAELPIPCGSTVNCVVSLEKNEYRGSATVSVRIRDISYAQTEREGWIQALGRFERLMRREECPPAEEALPDRELLARVYSMIHSCGVWAGTAEQLQMAVARIGGRTESALPAPLPLLVALETCREAGLIAVLDRGELLEIRQLPAAGKADLTQTPVWRFIMRKEDPCGGA